MLLTCTYKLKKQYFQHSLCSYSVHRVQSDDSLSNFTVVYSVSPTLDEEVVFALKPTKYI